MNGVKTARKPVWVCLMLCLLCVSASGPGNKRYFVRESEVRFVSEAPLERIEAVSTALKGVLDPESRSLAFSVVNRSFKGFNSSLQREHFNENYVESDKYPECRFTGKIVDEVNFYSEGVFQIRVKGMLTVKGVAREQIIRGTLRLRDGRMEVECSFPVSLADHQIRVPKLVYQKIAPVIQVNLKATMVEGEEP